MKTIKLTQRKAAKFIHGEFAVLNWAEGKL
jgi:hypothetical protein